MKKISAFMSILLIFTLLAAPIASAEGETETKEKIPAQAAEKASEKAAGIQFDKAVIERLVKMVKTKITIPGEYQAFTSSVDTYTGKPLLRLNWSTGMYTPRGGSVDVTVDRLGNIISFNRYKYSNDYGYLRRLPKVEKKEAVAAAGRFVCNICPELESQLDMDISDREIANDFDGSYRINYTRVVNGIPFPENGVTVTVNGQTGEVVSFSRNWRDDATFPNGAKALNLEAAQKAYRSKLNLTLKYKRTYGLEKDTTYLEYSPSESSYLACIDAFTGESLNEVSRYYLFYDDLYRVESLKREAAQLSQINLTGGGADELKDLQGLLGIDEAEKTARNISELGIDTDCKLSGYSYYRDTGNTSYTVRLDFFKPASAKDFGKDIPPEKLKVMIAAGEGGRNISVTLDAKTGELAAVNAYGYGSSLNQPPLDRTAMQKSAESFLEKLKFQKFSQAKLSSSKGNPDPYSIKYGVDAGNPGSFIYYRTVNGISFEDDRLAVTIDQQTGKISNYNESWSNVDFIPAQGVISLEQAYKVLFEKNGLSLRYATIQPAGDKAGAPYYGNPQSGEIRLVYSVDFNKPVCVGAKNGALINYMNGTPYIEAGSTKYNDIKGHPAEAMITLSGSLGLLMPEDSFRPDAPMLQKDYIYIISKLRGAYYVASGAGIPSQREMDGIYRSLINDGVIDEEEKDPDAELTREEAVKYLMRAAGYRNFAEMKDLFLCDFKDRDQIEPANRGYASIAKSIGVTGGEYFKPEQQLTRAEALELIYNYMKR